MLHRFLQKIDAGVFNQQLLTWMKSAKIDASVNVNPGTVFLLSKSVHVPGRVAKIVQKNKIK